MARWTAITWPYSSSVLRPPPPAFSLTSRRSYKEAWEEDRAYSETVSGSGTQFDPGVVAAFERVYDQVLAVRKKYVD